MTLALYHGANARHEYLRIGTWVTTSLREAMIYALVRCNDLGDSPQIATFEIEDETAWSPEVELGDTCVNGTLRHPQLVLDWRELYQCLSDIPEIYRKWFDGTATIHDLKHLIKG